MSTAPTRTLLLLRHAKSSWTDPGIDDFDRPLSPRGQRAAGDIARVLAGMATQPTLVICSAARRTRETLEGIRRGLTGRPETRFERSLYLADPDHLARVVRGLPDIGCAMLIGHNPGLHELAVMLAGDGGLRRRLAEHFPTGALAALTFRGEWRAAGPGSGHLAAFVVPRDLE